MKSVLIITYYWPPAGGPGVQRWLKFVKYFRDFGIEPIVYIPENPNYPLIEKRFSDEISQDIKILKHPITEPYRIADFLSKKKTRAMSSGIIPKKDPSFLEKTLLYIRGNFFIPDARVFWVKPSVKFLSKYLADNPVDVIVTTGPPHSLHLIGKRLKETLHVSWIADFRDPWTTIHYHTSLRLNKRSRKKHRELEKAVLDAADQLIVTSPTTKKEFQQITKTPVKVITNGFDVAETREVTLDSKFSVSHIGSLLSERNPEVLWQVLSEISVENRHFKNDLKLIFAGAISPEIKEELQKYGLFQNTDFLGYVSHAEALRLQRRSQVLLLVEIDRPETRAIIPGKLFEYLSAKRPILALGPEGSDIEAIIKETGAGKFFNYQQKDKLKALIVNYYSHYKDNQLSIDSRNIRKYSRRELTGVMAELIRGIK